MVRRRGGAEGKREGGVWLVGGCYVSLAGSAISIIFVATKLLSRQTRLCRDKHLVVPNDRWVWSLACRSIRRYAS